MVKQTYGNLTPDARHTLISKGWKASGVVMRYGGKAKSIAAIKRSLWRSGYTVYDMFKEEKKKEKPKRWYSNYIAYNAIDYVKKRGDKHIGARGKSVYRRDTQTVIEIRGMIWAHTTKEKNRLNQRRLEGHIDDIYYRMSEMGDSLIETKEVVNKDYTVTDKETIQKEMINGGATKEATCYFTLLIDDEEIMDFSEDEINDIAFDELL